MYNTAKNLDIKGKRILVRLDLNVPIKDGIITNNYRIKAALPLLNHLIKNHCRIILMSHLGRPKGNIVESLRMNPVAKELENELGLNITKLNDITGTCVKKTINHMKEGDIVLLENVQFHPGEISNCSSFASELASYADFYIMDCFGQSHRNYASLVAIQDHIKSFPGPLVKNEINNIERCMKNTSQPIVAVIGGSKLETKIPVILKILPKVSKILIGGAMTFTFLKAMGQGIGTSYYEKKNIGAAKEILRSSNGKIILPKDIVVASDPQDKNPMTVDINKIPNNLMGLDIGKETIEEFRKILNNAHTIIWNGPVGMFEKEPYDHGTRELVGILNKSKAFRFVGGGDSVAALDKFGGKNINFVSTGGGASLEFLSGKELPAIEALKKNAKLAF